MMSAGTLFADPAFCEGFCAVSPFACLGTRAKDVSFPKNGVCA